MARKKKQDTVTKFTGPVLRPVRRLRHWKQQFDKNAHFIWRKNVTYGTTIFVAGQRVPDGLIPTAKLRRFWESRFIELAEFKEPKNVLTGQVEPDAPKEKKERKLRSKKAKKSKKG